MNIRKLIVKGLYPICSDEVQILIDQMQNNPDKFTDLLRESYSLGRDGWNKIILQKDNFGIIDSIAVRHQYVQLKHTNTKQMILEALLSAKEPEANKPLTTALSNTALTKAQIDKQFKEEYARYKEKNNL